MCSSHPRPILGVSPAGVPGISITVPLQSKSFPRLASSSRVTFLVVWFLAVILTTISSPELIFLSPDLEMFVAEMDTR